MLPVSWKDQLPFTVTRLTTFCLVVDMTRLTLGLSLSVQPYLLPICPEKKQANLGEGVTGFDPMPPSTNPQMLELWFAARMSKQEEGRVKCSTCWLLNLEIFG